MKTFLTAVGLAVGATSAALPRQDKCCFSLTSSGGQSGQVGQLSDGQNRIGGGHPAGQYCLSGSSITDGEGRGCILTPPTTQLQCDEGATPDSGFSVSSNGELRHNGDSTFYACAAAQGQYNIYTSTSDAQTECSKITLTTSGECSGNASGGSGSSESASQPAVSGVPSAPAYSVPPPSPVAPESSAAVPSGGAPPAYSAPGSSPAAPMSTAPASSAPGYSAPAGNGPAPSAPAPSAPAESASAPSGGVSTRIVTQYTTVCRCSEGSGLPSSAPGVPAPSATGAAPTGLPEQSGPQGAPPPQTYPASGESSAPVPSGSVPALSESAPAPIGTPAESSPGAPPQTYPVPGESSAPVPPGSVPAPSESSPGAPPQTYSVPGESSAPVPPGSVPALSESTPAPTGYPTESVGAPPQSYPVPGQSSAETPVPSQPPTGTATGSSSGSGSTCATSLVKGSYETPHLIVPVNSQSPDQSYGTSYNAYVNSQNSTVFNFDIPQSDEGKTCTLVFLFPKKEDLETTDYTFNGQGSLSFAQLSGAVDEQTSYSSCPPKAKDLGSVTPQPGGSYVVQSGACAAGSTETFEMSAAGGLELEFFEDWNPSPLGVFITVC